MIKKNVDNVETQLTWKETMARLNSIFLQRDVCVVRVVLVGWWTDVETEQHDWTIVNGDFLIYFFKQ